MRTIVFLTFFAFHSASATDSCYEADLVHDGNINKVTICGDFNSKVQITTWFANNLTTKEPTTCNQNAAAIRTQEQIKIEAESGSCDNSRSMYEFTMLCNEIGEKILCSILEDNIDLEFNKKT